MIESNDLFESNSYDTKPNLQIISGVGNTFKALRNPFLKTDEAIELLTAISYDPEHVRAWIDQLRSLKKELFYHPRMAQQFKDEMYVALNARINELSQLDKAASLNYSIETWMDWEDFNHNVFIKPFLKGSGTLIHISGTMDSGKTDLSCTLGDYCLEHNFTVITNIAFKGDLPKGLIRTLRLSELLLEMIDARLEGRNVIVIFDEVSQFFSKRESGKRENIQFEKLLRLTRKFRTNMIFVEQIKFGLPSVALELLTARYHKIGKKKVQYSTRFLEKNYNLFLASVPRTKLKFDTLHVGGFRTDIDLGILFRDVLIEEQPEEALREAIKNGGKKPRGGIY